MKKEFKKLIALGLVAAFVFTNVDSRAFAAQVVAFDAPAVDEQLFNGTLGNPSFEDEIGNGTAGNWDNTNGATRVTTNPVNGTFKNGVAGLRLSPPDNNFRFTFQTHQNVKEGDLAVFSGFVATNIDDDFPFGAPADLGAHIKIEFRMTNADGTTTLLGQTLSSFATATTTDFQHLTVSAVAPAGTQFAVFTMVAVNDTNSGGAEVAIFDRMVAAINPSNFSVQLAKRKAKVGDVVPALVTFKNETDNTFSSVKMTVVNPKGINVNLSDVRKDFQQSEATQGSVIIPMGTVNAGQTVRLTLPLMVTSGVEPGHVYDIDFFISDAAGLTRKVRERLLIENDPMFDESTLIGKVFHDRNHDGQQQDGEEGMPFVNLYTEQGVMVTTDENGMYHIPNVQPGRHVIKIDAHTLPANTEFVTEESYLFKSTPGVMNKVNFAVAPRGKADWEGGNPNMPKEFQGDLDVQITQGLDTAPPRLDVLMEPDVLKLGVGVLEQKPIFTFDINYPHMVKKWWLEIRDEMGRKVWSGYGAGKPPADVMWEGIADSGVLVQPGIYSYQFKVEDDHGRQDWSLLKFFRVFSKAGKVSSTEDWEGSKKDEMVYQTNPKAEKNYREEIPPVGNFNIFKDGKRSIPLVAQPTIMVRGRTKPGYKAYVNDAPVDVDGETGRFNKEFYVKPGENEFVVNVVSPQGESTLYTEKVKVKDSMFFLVGLGEEELGKNFAKGSVETIGADKQYRDGFYQDGRLSYFLKGKLKGKFLVKSKFDSGDKRTGLFTNLDPDQYYPIYGDNSKISYEGQNTADRFYMLVEMDRSFARWGSFETKFDDTELASYNRTLSGLQVHHESLSTTAYGDPKRGFKVFWSESPNRAAHVELESTGGTLYYLRDRNIVQGSEQIKVEIRDKIQDMSIGTYDLHEGVDYEIDYDTGRIMLSRPLSSLAVPNTLFSTDLADGNRVFLIADYEYVDNFDPYKNADRGARGYVHMGDHVRIGGTAVEEKRQGEDYDLRGVDMTMKFGRNTKITSEYATTMKTQMDQAVSFDGGFNYANLGSLPDRKRDGRERAYLVKGESKPLKNFEVNGFLQGIEPGFSNDTLRSQEGFKKYGLAGRYHLADNLYAKYRFDHSEVVESLLPLTTGQVRAPYENFIAHTFGVTYDSGQWLAETEYFRRMFSGPDSEEFTLPAFESAIPINHGITSKLGYRVNEKLMPYAKVQNSIGGKGDHQFGGGVRYEVTKDLYAYLEQMFGKIGDSTLFGIEKQHGNGSSTYANLKSLDRGVGSRALSTAIGSNYFFDNGSRMYSEREITTYNAQDGFANIFGYDGNLGDHWDYGTRYERRHMQNSTTRGIDTLALDGLARTNTYNTYGAHLAYIGSAQKTDGADAGKRHYSPFERIKARVSGEFRKDSDQPDLWQIVTRDSLEYKITRDLSFLSYLNLAYSQAEVTRSSFGLDANFMEWNTGFAYRPVNFDKFNMLMRYTRIVNHSNSDVMAGIDLNTDDSAHIIQADAAYDINRWFQIVEKIGFKRAVAAMLSQEAALSSVLWANRLNFHVTRKWDIASEYRIFMQGDGADTKKHGALFEVDRELYDYVRIGAGYDFANFTDDLRKSNNYQSHGPFVRMTGKF